MQSMNKRVVVRLSQLAQEGPQSAEAVRLEGGYIVGVPAGETDPASAALTLEDYDRYSAALRSLEVRLPENGQPPDGEALRGCAEAIAERLSYLEEPLTVLEVDEGAHMAQVRSDPPLAEAENVIYWEALLQARPQPQVRLSRYHWRPGQPDREQLAYPATFATLGRLAEDLRASLSIINE